MNGPGTLPAAQAEAAERGVPVGQVWSERELAAIRLLLDAADDVTARCRADADYAARLLPAGGSR